MSYCTTCLPQSGYKEKAYEFVAPDLAAYYQSKHIAYTTIPPHNPTCTRSFDGQAPVITSLQNGKEYIIVDKNKQTLLLSCNVANDVAQVYWYVNDYFIGSATAGKSISFTPNATKIKISCTDDKGRNTDINIQVKY
jgi:penicillin-binding protein 1C